jgi:hypothetical protein
MTVSHRTVHPRAYGVVGKRGSSYGRNLFLRLVFAGIFTLVCEVVEFASIDQTKNPAMVVAFVVFCYSAMEAGTLAMFACARACLF